jgi:DNA-binding transcriptional LysR family regulator
MDWLTATRSFCMVVEHGSFTEASKVAEVSPSAISKRIEWLEKSLKLTLFVRTTRQIHLTEAGHDFLPRANSLIGQFDSMITEIQFGAKHPSGMLRIAAPLSVGSSILMPHIEAFLDLHPAVKIQLDVQTFGSNPDLDHDLVICRKKEDFDSASHRGVKLKTYRMGIYASPDYLKKHPPITSISELEKHNMIIASFQRKLGVIEMNNGQEISLAKHNFVSDNLDALLYAAIVGMGVIFATRVYIKKEVDAGLLVPVLPEVKSTDRELWAFYPKTEHMPLKSRLFLDFIKGRL